MAVVDQFADLIFTKYCNFVKFVQQVETNCGLPKMLKDLLANEPLAMFSTPEIKSINIFFMTLAYSKKNQTLRLVLEDLKQLELVRIAESAVSEDHLNRWREMIETILEELMSMYTEAIQAKRDEFDTEEMKEVSNWIWKIDAATVVMLGRYLLMFYTVTGEPAQ